jgi:fibronectin-binding autotransporter adhesin
MKSKFLPLFRTSFTAAIFATGSPVFAASLTWDAGVNNDWNTTTDNWVGAATWNNATPDQAVFGPTGVGTVTLAAPITAGGITFNTAGYIIAGNAANTLTLSGSAIVNADAAISAVLAGSGAITKAGTAKLTLSGNNTRTGGITVNNGTLEVTGGILNVSSGEFEVSASNTATGTWSQTSGAVTVSTANHIYTGMTAGGTSNLNFSGGTFNVTAGNSSVTFSVGGRAQTSVNVSGNATIDSYQTRFGWGSDLNATDGGTLNIDGGTWKTNRIYQDVNVQKAEVNFNGGILQARQTNSNFISGAQLTANVKEGGAKIDSNGFNITISKAMTHGGVATTDGGLTKSGNGILTISAVNTYTGDTDIQGGTLKLATGSSIASTSSITVGSGTFLDVTALASSSLTLGGAQTLKGSGTVSGTVITGANTSTISPGTSSGTLTLSGLNVAAGGSFNFDLGSSSDLIDINGELTGSTNASDLKFNFTNAGGFVPGTPYTLFTFDSLSPSNTLQETDLAALTLPSGWALDTSFDGNGWKLNANSLQVQFVPEPTSALLGCLGLLALLRRRRA